ncbi:MAG: NuoI/complex I 23 kDa subunit family protein [Chloroflexota bacterium]|jgi:NADH-quinone oxidoreductase subunit I
MIKKVLYKLFFIEILKGMALTVNRLFSHAVTRQYPTEKRPAMPGFRGLHAWAKNADGSPRCVHCGACAAACPSKCIYLAIAKDAEGKPVKQYSIDTLRCLFCGLCVEACPYSALVLTGHYEYSGTTRDEFMFNKERLLDNWDNYMAGEPGERYFERFYGPKSSDYTGHDGQAVFDRVRLAERRKEREESKVGA